MDWAYREKDSERDYRKFCVIGKIVLSVFFSILGWVFYTLHFK